MPKSGAERCERTYEMGFAYPEGYDPELSAHDVKIIQELYMERSLRLLDDERASDSTRSEVLDWVAAELVPMERIEDIPAIAFQCCCYTAGVDPDAMREIVLLRFAPDRLANLIDD